MLLLYNPPVYYRFAVDLLFINNLCPVGRGALAIDWTVTLCRVIPRTPEHQSQAVCVLMMMMVMMMDNGCRDDRGRGVDSVHLLCRV